MLDALDEVPWDELSDAYGPADDVPDHLRRLAEGDADEAALALEQLWMALCQQRASVAEASAAAVPFLVELARGPIALPREGVLGLLEGMAEVVCAPAADHAATGLHGRVRAALHDADLRAFLADPEPDVRARAVLTLSALHARTGPVDLELRLLQLYASEPAVDTRVACVEAFERLGLAAALEACLTDPDLAVRLAAALALLPSAAPDSPPFVLVQAALESPRATRAAYGTASRFRPLALVRRVCAAGAAVAEALFPPLLRVLAQSPAALADDTLAPLLTTFFPTGLSPAPSLLQSALALTIAQHRGYFGVLANGDAVLAAHGLPARPRLLRAYAARGPAGYETLVPAPPPERPASDVLASLLGRRAPDSVTSLVLVGTASDALLARLSGFSHLRQLSLKSSPATVHGLTQLAHVPALEELWLEDMTLDAASVRSLFALPLRRLSLRDLTLSPEAQRALEEAPPGLRLTADDLRVRDPEHTLR